jgi:ketosteroid isomerase-like protein
MFGRSNLPNVGDMDAQRLIQLTTDTWNDRDRDAWVGAYHQDCELTHAGFVGKGQQGLAEFWTIFMDAFPDNRIRVISALGDSGTGAEESVFEGTHTGTLVGADGSGIPPTGRRASLGFAGIHRVRDGRLASSHFYSDTLELLTQLGIGAGPTAG